MKKKSLLLAFAVVAFLQPVKAQNNIIDEVVWVVGDEPIYKSEVEEVRRDAQLQGVRWDGDPYCIIPEQLAVNKLYLNQAILDSIEATTDEVNERVEYIFEDYVQRAGSEEKLIEFYNGMNVNQIKAKLFESQQQELIISRVRRKLMERVKVTPGEVRRYIKDIAAEDIPSVPTQVEVQIISLNPIVPQEEIDAVKAELREYSERIQSGEAKFSTLALLYSDDPVSAKKGGDCGFMGRAEIVPEFSAVAFNLTDPTKVSKIVETEYGFHIIQLIERMGDRVRVRHILRKPKVPVESINECLAKLDTIADDIRSGKETFEHEVAALSEDKDTKNNNGLMTYSAEPGMPGTSRFRMDQLQQDVAKVVDKMHVGEVSDPFTMQLDNGKIVCAVVKLKNRINAHKANMSDDYELLYQMVYSERCQAAIDKWIREKQRTTYVRINEGWNDCEFVYPGWGKQ